MNWELKKGHKDTVQSFLAGDFSRILAEGIEKFAPQLGGPMDRISFDGENHGPDEHGPCPNYIEYPDGPYIHEGPSYRFRTSVGFYGRGGKFISLEPPTYDLKVSRLGEQESLPASFSRKRFIKEVKAIQ